MAGVDSQAMQRGSEEAAKRTGAWEAGARDGANAEAGRCALRHRTKMDEGDADATDCYDEPSQLAAEMDAEP